MHCWPMQWLSFKDRLRGSYVTENIRNRHAQLSWFKRLGKAIATRGTTGRLVSNVSYVGIINYITIWVFKKSACFNFKVLKGITRLQATMKARLLSTKFKRMREDKLRAEQERLRRLEREKKQKENEAKLRKVREQKHKPSYIFITEYKKEYFIKVECSFVESVNSRQWNKGTSSKIKQ